MARGAAPIDPRHAEAGIVREILAQLRGGGGLEAQIHLEPHRLRQASPPPRAASAGAGAAPTARPGRPASRRGRGRARTRRAMPGRSTLTATSSPSVVTAKCTCAIEAAATGSSSKERKSARERLAELALDRGARLGAGKRRQPVLQLREIGRHLLADEIGAGRQRLAELDEARPHRLQRHGQPLARPQRWRAPRRAGARSRKSRASARRTRDLLERKERVVARQDQRDLDEPDEMAGRAGRRT